MKNDIGDLDFYIPTIISLKQLLWSVTSLLYQAIEK